jgi:hypothetical protein
MGVTLHHVGEVDVSDVVGPCKNCGSLTSALNGTYEFAEKAYLILKEAKLSRQQIRRFDLKLRKSKNIDELARQSEFINPAFAELTRRAKHQPSPKRALNTVVTIAKGLLATGVAAATIASGIIAADEISDRWQKDELFEGHAPNSDQIEDQLQEKPKEETKDDQPPRKSWGPEGSTEI